MKEYSTIECYYDITYTYNIYNSSIVLHPSKKENRQPLRITCSVIVFRTHETELNLSVSYEAETERICNPILKKQTLPSSDESPEYFPSSPDQTPPNQIRTHKITTDTPLDVSHDQTRDEPARPLFGVEALMDSIKQAIEKRHDVLEQSDEMSSRRWSFSSVSPTNSPTAVDVPEKQQLSPGEHPISSKPRLSEKPSLTTHKEPPPTFRVPPPAPKAPPPVPKVPPPVPKVPPPAPKVPPRAPKTPSTPQAKSNIRSKEGSGRSELLKSIIKGSNLRKTDTNDRSAPRL